MTLPKRTRWMAGSLRIDDEPLAKSLLTYNMKQDRHQVGECGVANLISSITEDGRQMPVLDLDYPHVYVNSTTDGHAHLYINVPMSYARWLLLMFALKVAGVIEKEHFWWSLRRGGNFVRIGSVKKTADEEIHPTYGWFFKRRNHG